MLGHRRLETFALCFSWLSSRALEVWRFRLQYDYATIGGRQSSNATAISAKHYFHQSKILRQDVRTSSFWTLTETLEIGLSKVDKRPIRWSFHRMKISGW